MISSFYLFLLIASLLNSSVISEEFLDCSIPKNFEIITKDNNKTFIYDADINVKYYQEDLSMCNIHELKIVHIFIPNMAISFSGYIVVGNQERRNETQKTFKIYNFEIAGSTQVIQNNCEDTKLSHCSLNLLKKNTDDDSILMNQIEYEIIHRMSTCIKSTICRKLGIIISDEIKTVWSQYKNGDVDNKYLKLIGHSLDAISNINTNNAMCLIPSYKNNFTSENLNEYEAHSFMDIIIDETINQIIQISRKENNGIINIPNIDEHFSTGVSIFKVCGEFNAFNGIFKDLTTLSREGYVTVRSEGLKRFASCGFGLSTAYFQYNNYVLKYGRIKVNGNISANINGVAVNVSLLADFDQKPCRLSLNNLQITKFGSIVIKITGGGGLNPLLSKLASVISNKWRNEIIKKIEQKIRDLTLQKISTIDCEKYRKFISK